MIMMIHRADPLCSNDVPGPATPEGPATATAPAPAPARPRTDDLPPFRVLLHNDDVNTGDYVVQAIQELTPLNHARAIDVMLEADATGVALVLTTHKERAELYAEQFTSKNLTVTIEPA